MQSISRYLSVSQLEYLVALDDHRHFAKAASDCFITQPTLSMQLQKLEDALGSVLFHREKRPIEPTPLGKIVIAQARRALRELHAIPSIIAEAKGKLEGKFRLGIIPTVAADLLPLFLGAFSKAYSRVELEIQELQTTSIMQALIEGHLDGGLLATPLGEKEIFELPLYYEPFWVYCSPGNPLLRKSKIRESDLSLSEAWLLTEGHCFRNQAMQLCRRKQQPTDATRPRLASGNLETLKRIVDEGSGFTLLPQLAADRIFQGPDKKRLRPFSSPVPIREISLVHHVHYPLSGLLTAVANSIRKAVSSELQRTQPKARLVGLGELKPKVL